MDSGRLNTEQSIIDGFRNGQEGAFATLYKTFYQRVLFFARRYVSEVEAQDITAEAFIQLWRKRFHFADTPSISNFLFVTARNRCLNHLRDSKYRKSRESDLISYLESTTAASLQAEEVRVQLVGLLNKEIDKLPSKMREIFLLSFKEGLKPAEIAQRLQINVKTVSNQKLNAIHLLREAVMGYPLESILLILLQTQLPGLA